MLVGGDAVPANKDAKVGKINNTGAVSCRPPAGTTSARAEPSVDTQSTGETTSARLSAKASIFTPCKPGISTDTGCALLATPAQKGTGGTGNRRTRQCHLWSKAVFSGLKPLKRSSHSSTMVGDKLYVFGGFSPEKWWNVVSILDTNTMTWIKRDTTGAIPCSRYAHAACQDGSTMYIFGGFGMPRSGIETYLNDVFALDIAKMKWRRLDDTLDWLPPCPRAAAAAALDSSTHTWYIHGGNAGDRRLTDMHALHLETQQWRQVCNLGM